MDFLANKQFRNRGKGERYLILCFIKLVKLIITKQFKKTTGQTYLQT